MTCANRDLTIDSALTDPVIGAAMRADRIDPSRFEALLRATARRLEQDVPRPALPMGALTGRLRRAVSECAAW